MSWSRRVVVTVVAPVVAALVAPALANASPGDFASAGEFQVGNTPYEIATGDFDADGNVDVVVPNANGSSASVLLGDGDGTFTDAAGSPLATGGSPLSVATSDLDGDGDSDFVVSESGPDTVTVFESDGDGTFTPGNPITVGTDPRGIAIGKFGAGNVPDIAVANGGSGTATILLGDGSGGFSPSSGSPFATSAFPTNIAVGQFDAVQGDDLAITSLQDGNVSILLGDSSGNFASAPNSPYSTGSGSGAEGIVAAKLNADDLIDLAIANSFAENTTILIGNGTGGFAPAATSPEPQGDNDVAAANLDADSDIDLATYDAVDKLAVLTNDGSANFSPFDSSPETVLPIAARVAAADLDNDGDNDLLSSGGNGGYYAITPLLNDEPDGDSDGVADDADQCPDVPGEIVDGCPAIPRTVSLSYKEKADAFKGRVASVEDACVGPGQKVRVLKLKNSGQPKPIGKTARTKASGRFRLDERVKRGRYVARVAQFVDPDVGRCAAAQSDEVEP